MSSRTRILLTLACCLFVVTASAQPATRAQAHTASPAPAAAEAASIAPGLTALNGCGHAEPPNANEPVCCMFGYVFLDGVPVSGAKVTVTNTANGKSVELFTGENANSTSPYYRLSLSSAPLSAQQGQVVDITADYSSHHQTVHHTVLGGGQQIDVVLPHNDPVEDYIFDWRIEQQPGQGVFNLPSGVAVDRSGSVYILDSQNNRVQVFDIKGVFVRQWGTQGDLAGQISTNPGTYAEPLGIVIDTDGNVYIADEANSRVQEFTNTGTWLRTLNLPDARSRPSGLALDSQGNLYVADWWLHRINKFNHDGVLVAQWAKVGGGEGSGNREFSRPHGIAIDSSGNLYIADSYNNRIQKLSSDGTYIDQWGTWGSADGQFNYPFGIAIDGADHVYVTERDSHRVQEFDTAGTFIRKWGDNGTGNGQFNRPTGITTTPFGSVYVADEDNHRIQIFDSAGTYITNWGSKGAAYGQFDQPHGLALDSQGNLYVADRYNHRIQEFSADGSFLRSWGSLGSARRQFNEPISVALDSSDNVYVTDSANNRIQKFSSNGDFIGQWGSAGTTGTSEFNQPWGIAVASNGTVYVSDKGNHRIQKFSSDGTYLDQWGSPGSGNDQFNDPTGVAVDSAGNVYVGDWLNGRIQKFTAAGTFVKTIAIPLTYNQDEPLALAFDHSDNLYVGDTADHVLLKFDSAGHKLLTVGGVGVGIGRMSWPNGVAVNSNGTLLYAAEIQNNRIQRFHAATAIKPIATVVATDQRTVTQGTAFNMSGRGGDSVEPVGISKYKWLVDGAGAPLTTADAILATGNLSIGTHTISFSVRDARDVESDPQTFTINVVPGSPVSTTWTFLLYLDGDTGGDIAPLLDRNTPLGALYRLEHSKSQPSNVSVYALYDGPRNGDSYYYKLDPNGTVTQENLPQDVNMGDPQTLIDFVAKGKQEAPADHYYLSIADHANGLDGIAWDYTSGNDERLTNKEVRDALLAITEGGSHPLDVLHFDGCLMGMIENAYQARGLARYVVESENLAWSAFAYDQYRAAIGPATSAQDLAKSIVDRYTQAVEGYPFTIAALDLDKMDAVVAKTNDFAYELKRYAYASEANRTTLTNLRMQTQKFDSLNSFQLTDEQEYVDLDSWAELVQSGVADSAVQSQASNVRSAIADFVLRERHASGTFTSGGHVANLNLAGAHGVAIYYPPKANVRTYQRYAQGDLNFPKDNLWDEFLAAQLGALQFDPTDPQPLAVKPLSILHRVSLPLLRR